MGRAHRFITAAAWLAVVSGFAAPGGSDEPALTDEGRAIEQRLTARRDELAARIRAAAPALDEARRRAYTAAREREVGVRGQLDSARKELEKLGEVRARVDEARNRYRRADQEIAAARRRLEKALDAEARRAAEADLHKWQADREAAERDLKERQRAFEAVQPQEAALRERAAALERELAEATRALYDALRATELGAALDSDRLDPMLVEHAVLRAATPRRLAAWAQQNAVRARRLDEFLSDVSLMRAMLVADGANGGRYDRAIEIYDAILASSSRAREGVLQRLALAIALVHAEPVKQDNPAAATHAPPFVDPVKRYLQFERAFLNGELDPAFERLDVWDLRWVVDGDEPDEILEWGRAMLREYRPDHVRNPDARWRYVEIMRSDIPYGSQDVKHDRPHLQKYQNILLNGGVCGRRAFIGRFILRAFGVPTTARPQKGHAALVHWTPDGWVVCLGATWGHGWTHTWYGRDLDFLATTQARALGAEFLRVKRAQWLGDAFGETPVYGIHGTSKPAGFWYGVSLDLQRMMIEKAGARRLEAVGTELGEADASSDAAADGGVADHGAAVSVNEKGEIHIPAIALRRPGPNSKKILRLKSIPEGTQIHYSRTGPEEPFEYEVVAPRGGRYRLTAQVAVASWGQSFRLSVNGASDTVEIPLPETVGRWGWTDPIEILLRPGTNVLTFTRDHARIRGVSLKEIILSPAQ